jgi:diguanylate cyclase (GGDEF)-like protein
MNNDWVATVHEKIAILESCLTSARGFSNLLGEIIRSPKSPISGVELIIEGEGGAGIHLGRACEGEANQVTGIALTGVRHSHAKLRIWYHDRREAGDPASQAKVVALLREAFDAWWIPDSRSSKSDLQMWTDATKRRGQGALSLQKGKKEEFSVAFFDLDNFKKVNDTLGQTGGDHVILKIAGFLEQAVADRGVVLHHGGDEFIIVLPESPEYEAIELSADIANKAKTFDFGTKEIPVGLSFGITSTSTCPSAEFEKLVKIADENALKLLVKKDPKIKGSMRVAGELQSGCKFELCQNPRDGIGQGLNLVLRSTLGSVKRIPAFASVWLNALVVAGRRKYALTGSLQDMANEIISICAAFKIPFGLSNLSIFPYGSRIAIEPCISAFDVAAAGARVIFEESVCSHLVSEGLNVIIKQSADQTFLIWGDSVLMKMDSPGVIEQELNLGPAWSITSSEKQMLGSIGEIHTSPFILMEIGRNHLVSLPFLAAAHIVIDDRPGRGGGLPDFWELCLSRVIQGLGSYPNVEKIVIVGDLSNGQQTVSKLHQAEDWDADYYSYKTSVQKNLVEQAKIRLKGNVAQFSTEKEAIEWLSPIVSVAKTLSAGKAPVEDVPDVLIRRKLSHSKAALGPSDGFRVKTGAEAYPLALELLRSDIEDEDLIEDQDGLKLRELVDFKVVVEEPDREQIPWFFRREKSELDSYFKKQFIEENGIFSQKLKVNDFEDRVLNHIKWAIEPRPDGSPFATRRSILVVPHEPSENPETMSPLGLVSIRLLPRISSTEVVVNFSFTWRTVEALIGFPYSLYGSLRYAEYLKNKLARLCPDLPIRLGFVSYVAHSLHFFVSKESHIIARRIVSESSL